MEDDGEGLLTIAGVLGSVFTAYGLISWCQTGVRQEWKIRLPVVVVIPVSVLLLVLPTLLLWADPEVKSSPFYLLTLTADGAAYLMLFMVNLQWLGISVSHDVVEQNNSAATLTVVSAVVAAALIYAGANTGTGPSLWNNVFCVLLGTAGFALFWLHLEISTKVSLAITEDRDLASGIRLSGYLLASGAVCARAVAGDWHSIAGTILDFLKEGAWLLALLTAAFCCEGFCQPTVKRPLPDKIVFGIYPAMFYLLLALGWIWHLGWWEGAK